MKKLIGILVCLMLCFALCISACAEEDAVMTHGEFEAAELDSPVVIETYVQAMARLMVAMRESVSAWMTAAEYAAASQAF